MVIPRKPWLRPEMTEKLLIGKLSINTNKQIFLTFFSKIYHLCRLGNQSNSTIYVNDNSINIYVKLNPNISTETEKNVNLHFSHYKSMVK